MKLTDEMPIAFTAQSKKYFYCRDVICAFVMHQGYVPLNPFRVFEYFLDDRVERNMVRRGNFNLIRIADELWVFGRTIADGVLAEIQYAQDLGKQIKFFSIGTQLEDIRPISIDDVKFETEVHTANGKKRIKRVLLRRFMERHDPQSRLF